LLVGWATALACCPQMLAGGLGNGTCRPTRASLLRLQASWPLSSLFVLRPRLTQTRRLARALNRRTHPTTPAGAAPPADPLLGEPTQSPHLSTSLVDCLCQLMPAFTKATPPLATLLFQKSIYGCLHPQVYIPKAQRLFFPLSSIGWHFIVALS